MLSLHVQYEKINRVNGNNTNNQVNNDYKNEITWGMKGGGWKK